MIIRCRRSNTSGHAKRSHIDATSSGVYGQSRDPQNAILIFSWMRRPIEAGDIDTDEGAFEANAAASALVSRSGIGGGTIQSRAAATMRRSIDCESVSHAVKACPAAISS